MSRWRGGSNPLAALAARAARGRGVRVSGSALYSGKRKRCGRSPMPATNHPGSLVETARLRFEVVFARSLVVAHAQPAD